MLAPGYLDILRSVDTATRRTTSDETATVDRVKSDLAEIERSRRETGRLPSAADPTERREPATRPSTEPGREREPSDLERATERIAPGAPQGARDPLLEATSAEGEREREREKSRGKIMSVQEMAEVLRHGQTINTLASDDRRRLGELIGLGQTALKAGDYFAAERRFIQAQDYRSGNPMIEVGMAHAQLGGGTYLSATLTLRQLFMAHPELIDTRYDRALLPSGERLESAVKRIRERIALGEDRSDYGFLLAYIGHQTGDRALVEEGLREVAGTPSLDTYGELLRGIWLGGK